jgi:hypothetical protein
MNLFAINLSNILSNFVFSLDATRKKKVKFALEEAKCLPVEGFDLIFIRHPDVLSSERAKAFEEMLKMIIPYVASKNAIVFISCYNEFELEELGKITNEAGVYYKAGAGNYVYSDGAEIVYPDGVSLNQDLHSVLLTCEGLAFKDRLTVEAKAAPTQETKAVPSSEVKAQELKPGEGRVKEALLLSLFKKAPNEKMSYMAAYQVGNDQKKLRGG